MPLKSTSKKKSVIKPKKSSPKTPKKARKSRLAASQKSKLAPAAPKINETEKIPAVAGEADFETRKTKIKIIGLGGGGSNIVAGIAARIKKASFCIVNTDYQALANAGGDIATFQFGQKYTKGLGTGMDSALAEEAARDEREKIKKMLEGNDLVILVAALGGGTGSGFAPVFAQISKSLGNLTYGIFSMPFDFEGAKKDEIARAALERTRPYLSALTILPNERVFQVVPKTTPFTKTMAFINDNLSKNLEGLIEMIYEPGMINIDFADVRTILSGQGKLAFLNTFEFQKSDGAEIESFDSAFLSQLYPYAIDRARGLLINVGGQKDLRLSEVNKILTSVNSRLHKDAKIILGISQADQTFEGVRVTVLATGCTSNGQENNNNPASQSINKNQSVQPQSVTNQKSTAKRAAKPIRAKKNKKINIKIKTRPAAASGREDKKEISGQSRDGKLAAAAEADHVIKIEDGPAGDSGEVALRKNAIEVRKEIEREEKEMLESEKAWEIPAFLRKRPKKK